MYAFYVCPRGRLFREILEANKRTGFPLTEYSYEDTGLFADFVEAAKRKSFTCPFDSQYEEIERELERLLQNPQETFGFWSKTLETFESLIKAYIETFPPRTISAETQI